MRIRHELKCWPEVFQPTLNGVKRFELRRDDRGGFKVGDELLLKEWVPETKRDESGQLIVPQGYTGREVLVRVDFVMTAEQAAFIGLGWENKSPISPGFVIMSVSLLP